MKKNIRVLFCPSPKTVEILNSTFLWNEVKKYSKKKLITQIFKYLAAKDFRFQISKIDCFGEVFSEHGEKDQIALSPTYAVFSDYPAILVHEVLHSIFPQLEENLILELEFRVMRNLSLKEANKILKYFFQSNWKFKGPINRKLDIGKSYFKKLKAKKK